MAGSESQARDFHAIIRSWNDWVGELLTEGAWCGSGVCIPSLVRVLRQVRGSSTPTQRHGDRRRVHEHGFSSRTDHFRLSEIMHACSSALLGHGIRFHRNCPSC